MVDFSVHRQQKNKKISIDNSSIPTKKKIVKYEEKNDLGNLIA